MSVIVGQIDGAPPPPPQFPPRPPSPIAPGSPRYPSPLCMNTDMAHPNTKATTKKTLKK